MNPLKPTFLIISLGLILACSKQDVLLDDNFAMNLEHSFSKKICTLNYVLVLTKPLGAQSNQSAAKIRNLLLEIDNNSLNKLSTISSILVNWKEETPMHVCNILRSFPNYQSAKAYKIFLENQLKQNPDFEKIAAIVPISQLNYKQAIRSKSVSAYLKYQKAFL